MKGITLIGPSDIIFKEFGWNPLTNLHIQQAPVSQQVPTREKPNCHEMWQPVDMIYYHSAIAGELPQENTQFISHPVNVEL